mgnify:CR=1 FL=1
MTISASANSKSGHLGGTASAPGLNIDPKAIPAALQTPLQEMRKTRERIVVLMMALVAAAIAAMFHMHLGYSLLWAGASGCAVLAGFVALHTLRTRTSQIARLRNDVVRLEQELGRLRSPPSSGGTMPGIAVGAITPQLESGTERTKSTASAPAAPFTPAQAAGAFRMPSSAPIIAPSQAPAPTGFGPEPSDAAPERISPDARWEAPGLSRTVNPVTRSKPEAIGQSAAPAPATHKAERYATAATPSASSRTGARPDTPELFEAPSWSGTSISSTDPLRDAWSFRPKDAVEARSFAPDAGDAAEPAPRMPSPPGSPPTQSHQARGIEADLEMVQRKIKAMAEEVNAAEAVRLRPPAEPARTSSSASHTMAHGYTSSSADFGTAAMAIEDGISALKNAAGAMRSPAAAQAAPRDGYSQVPATTLLPPADLLIPSTAQTIAVSAPPIPVQAAAGLRQPEPLSGSAHPTPAYQQAARFVEPRLAEARIPEATTPEIRDGRVTEIAKAIEAKRMDVLLSPIVGLGDYAVTHFEVVVRLRNADGTQFDRPEEALTLAGNHLLALFDAERLSRTAAVAELLQSRGKNGSVMTAASGASMSDANFLETFARVYETRNSISGQLVLTFSQADVEAFGSGTWQALSDMHSFGFRFALDHVTHLGMDFEHLAQCGFTFVKLPAQVFLKGLPSDSGFITVNDICRHLARCGLTLVVESVDDEALLARVFGFGALFGQGQLFGALREISLDTLTPAQSAAA